MRSSVLIASAGLALSAGAALGEVNFPELTFHKVASFKIGDPRIKDFRWNPTDPGIGGSGTNPDPAIYDQSAADLTGDYILNQGTTLQGAVAYTHMIGDDATTTSYPAGSFVSRFYMSWVNASANNLAPTILVRVYSNTGPGGGAGTFVGGFNFSSVGLDANSINLLYVDLTAGFVNLPGTGGTFWLSQNFRNSGVNPGNNPNNYPIPTTADMNFFGQATMGAGPTVGSSTDNLFETATGNNFTGTNPAGSVNDDSFYNKDPGTQLMFALFRAPAPSSAALLGLGGLIATRRRRQA